MAPAADAVPRRPAWGVTGPVLGKNPIMGGVRRPTRGTYWPGETLRLRGWLLAPIAVRDVLLFRGDEVVARAGTAVPAREIEQAHPGIEAAGSRFLVELPLAPHEGTELQLTVEVRGAFGHVRRFGPYRISVLGKDEELSNARVRWFHDATGEWPLWQPAATLPAAPAPVVPPHEAPAGGESIPWVSFCILASGAPREAWQRTLRSLLAQDAGSWDATLLLDGDKPRAADAAAAGPRCTVATHGGGTAAAALDGWWRQARGDYLAVVAAGDELDPRALGHVVCALTDHPAAEWLYTDEDVIAADGRHADPHFKPAWSPERLLCHFYLGQLSVIAKRCVARAGGFSAGDGAALHGLALAAGLTDRTVVHLPHVLHHRAPVQAPAALSTASRETLQRVFAAAGAPARLRSAERTEGVLPEFQLADFPPVTILVPTKDSPVVLSNCVRSVLERTDYPSYRVVVIDNGSTGARTWKVFEELVADPRVTVFRYPAPFNYAAMHNAVVATVPDTHLLLLNDDTEVISTGWLRSMVGWLQVRGVGAVGAKLSYCNDTIQHAGIALGRHAGRPAHVHRFLHDSEPGHHGDLLLPRNVSAVTGACLLTTCERYLEAGGMDESLPVAYNDVDLCLRIRASGARIVWDPQARLYHFEGQTRRDAGEEGPRFAREVEYLARRWGRAWEEEFYFSPRIPTPDQR